MGLSLFIDISLLSPCAGYPAHNKARLETLADAAGFKSISIARHASA
jgi:hypothetical protein